MIRTVLGDIAPDELGPTNYHEHLFQTSPLLPGDELDDPDASLREARLLAASGFAAMVDATPIGLGRDATGMARISARTGLSVVATTGTHREAHYHAGHWLRTLDVARRAKLFVRDIVDGMPDADAIPDKGAPAHTPAGDAVRAGLVKAGVGYWSITPFERTTLDAAAVAHGETGVPVMVHLEFCTAAHEVLDLLEAEGVAPRRVVLAHADRDPDPDLHLDLAARGAWLGYDGMARPRTRSEAELLDLAERVVARGGGTRILLGGDVARASRYIAYGGMPGLAYLGERYLPRLRKRIGDEATDAMLLANPRTCLSLH
ncbi:phosphotriesterase family protein [Luethyella okanaganae]|uniref:Phosphotriesterase n=1 Tax=Luethyella okanaganae TaxID=69372 RepID=A0ABW1VHI8_9MICO